VWPGERIRYSDWLRAGRSGDRIPVEARFSAPVQTGPGCPPSLLYNGYRVFPGVKERPGRDADPSPNSSTVGHERVELYRYSPYGPYGLYRASVPVQGCTLTFFTYSRNNSGFCDGFNKRGYFIVWIPDCYPDFTNTKEGLLLHEELCLFYSCKLCVKSQIFRTITHVSMINVRRHSPSHN